jgi:Mg-chelatase subunit ChlD
MRGERVRMAAATAGALADQLGDDEVGVVAFWSDAAVLRHLTRRLDAARLIDELASVPARGLTNVAFGLQAAGQVVGQGRGDRRVLMISDCVHNAGPDPAAVARGLPRVDVLVDVSGEHDLDVARAVARGGRGLAVPVRSHRDVASAVSRCFHDRAAAVRR